MPTGEIKRLVEEESPFLKKTGLRFEDGSPTEARVRLPLLPDNLNQAGAVHAGAIFTLAEAAAATLGSCAFDPAVLTFITKSVEMRYRRPGKGDLWGQARLDHDTAEAAHQRTSTEGKVDVPVPVEVADQAGEPVAQATVTLSLRRL